MNYEWEIIYIDLDADQLVLKLTHGGRRCAAMHILDRAYLHDWAVGDLVAIDSGDLSSRRETEKIAGMQISEDDYTMYNQRTGGKAVSRKNDWEVEKTSGWLKELVAKGLVDCPLGRGNPILRFDLIWPPSSKAALKGTPSLNISRPLSEMA
jgi:hypothetical protein